jgi:hypothetical protein
MALDPSIALKIEQPDPTSTIASFLDIGKKQLDLQKGRATFGSDVARNKAETSTQETLADYNRQSLQAKVAQQQAVTSSAQSGATVDAANVQPLIGQQAANTQTAQTQAQSTHFKLTQEQGTAAMQQAGGLAQDPSVVNGDAGGAIKAVLAAQKRAVDLGVPEEQASVMFGRLLLEAHDNPKNLRNTIASLTGGGMSPGQQASQNFVPASQQQSVNGTDLRGNAVAQMKDQFGRLQQGAVPQQQPVAQQQPVEQPGSATPSLSNSQPPGPLVIPAGESQDTYKLLSTEREAARTTATQAPTIHRLNGEILDELGKATTGQYAGIIAKGQSVAGMLGASLTGNNDAERAASAYDLVDKYTTMAATRAAQSMGNDTATALNAQLKQNASVERNPTAIKKSIKLNDAILSGSEAYQTGLEASIAKDPQGDVFTKRKFDRAWAQNFDPLVMQIYNAKKAGDAEELHDLVTKPAGVTDAAWKQRMTILERKAQNLSTLATRGL